ncbi:hypothetical protein MNBD_GAMMA22-809 [hydrothermal vent metagenome]|uniref:Uncharacterized protein n=1 Tax=hydrothermal vent metagenome TaxID=652676 RepID=A0A3B1A610_9ZZZZ
MKKIFLSVLMLCVFSIQAAYADSVDINKADAVTISKNLKGIGLKKAKMIVEFRVANGPFRSIEDITKVKGVGSKILELNKSEIIVSKLEPKPESK